MSTQVHGSHWECLREINDVIDIIIPEIVNKANVVDAVEIFADCIEGKKPSIQSIFSLSINMELYATALIVTNKKKKINDMVTVYPVIQSNNTIRLTILNIIEWGNLIEAVIVGEREDGHSIAFFDTKYYKNKERYQIGNSYIFALAALAYDVKVSTEKSFSFEGEKAIDWLSKIGEAPEYNQQGEVEPVVFNLSNLVCYLPQPDSLDDAQFQSPIKQIDAITAFGKEYYKINITVFHNPEYCLDLYAKTSFFDNQPPSINEPLRGLIWTQGYLHE